MNLNTNTFNQIKYNQPTNQPANHPRNEHAVMYDRQLNKMGTIRAKVLSLSIYLFWSGQKSI